MTPPSSPHPLFLALVGPTACGKTALSLAVAEALDGEIISMDSRQVYRGMDVGTAKVDAVERGRVPHHGLDLVDPDTRYSAGRFARDARRWIADIRGRGRLPVLVGGTGFFLRAVMEPIFAEPPMDPRRREALRAHLSRMPRDELARWVQRLDPERAPLAITGGPQRMSRTLEVALLSGRPLSEWHRKAPADGPGLHGAVVHLTLPVEEVDRRIRIRTRAMVSRGLVDEVRTLLDAGYGPDAPGMTGTGYREVVRHLEGVTSEEEMVEEIARNTRRYARRQRTWLRHQLPPHGVTLDATLSLDEQLALVIEHWRASLGSTLPTRNEETG